MDRTPDLDDQVMTLFPLDGPYDSERTIAAARSIAGLVRYLNHATLLWKQPAALEYPSHLASTISNLRGALGGMQQLVGQLAEYAGMFGDHPGLYVDNGDDPGMTVQTVIAGLQDALRPLNSASTALSYASTRAHRLGIRE